MTSTMSDFIIRIKNGYMSGREHIDAPYSKTNEMIAVKLAKEGYISQYQVGSEGHHKKIDVTLSYPDGKPALRGVKLFSTPGKRMYKSVKDIKPVMGGYGILILSTPKGILTNKESKIENVGGEMLFQIW